MPQNTMVCSYLYIIRIKTPNTENESISHVLQCVRMMTSLNGNIFCVTGPLFGDFTGHRWAKANDAEFWCLPWSALWINGWVNNRETGGLRRYRAHYDVIVMDEANSFRIHGSGFPTCINSRSGSGPWKPLFPATGYCCEYFKTGPE